MKHFLFLLLLSIGLVLTPNAAGAEDPAEAPVTGDPQSGGTKLSVIGLPPVPLSEISFGSAAGTTPAAGSNGLGIPLNLTLRMNAFAALAPVGAPTTRTGVDTRFAFEAAYARGFARHRNLVFFAEFPVVFSPGGDVNSSNSFVARDYSSLFFTPALRVMYAPDSKTHSSYPAIYPWISLGGGLAHFNPSSVNLAGGLSGAKSSTEGALQAGVGADFGIYKKRIALRTELRDFYSAPPDLGVPGINLRHNLVAGVGIVFHFGYKDDPGKQPDPSQNPR